MKTAQAEQSTPMNQTAQTAIPTKKTSTLSKALNIQTLFLFLVFPLSEVIYLFLCAQEVYSLYELSLPAFFPIILGCFFFFILIAFIFKKQYSQKHITRNYQELLNIQQYQKKHYEAIQQQRQHLEDIKNSFEGQLAEVSALLQTEQAAEALRLLQSLTREIEATKEYPFCPNPVINAVLSDKEQICREYQIAFHADMQLGACDTVEKLHLCSIFSNLLDNALEAARQLQAPADRYIHLTAIQRGDYLHIKVKNSSMPPLSPKEGHGYGQKILKDIAAKYSGSFQAHYKNHTYEAYICIRLP